VRKRDAAWTGKLMQKAYDRCIEVFGEAPKTHGAAGWQMSASAFEKLDAFGMEYSSDGRSYLNEDGTLRDADAGPYKLQVNGKTLRCLQMPTTLPTLDEMLGREVNGTVMDPSNIAATILKTTAVPRDHVFTLHAELEGQKLAPIFEELLKGWKAQGYELGSMADYYQRVKHMDHPVRPMAWGELPGRSGEVIV
jgi:undecaprenyl phosphate-alpha-L-ara4FN deformylase